MRTAAAYGHGAIKSAAVALTLWLAACPAVADSSPDKAIAAPEISQAQRWLSDRGIDVGAVYSNSALANLRGGIRRGVIDQGKLETTVAVDLEKLVGLGGLSFYANTFLIHNTGRFRRDYVGGINSIDAIEAAPSPRLSELWLEQKLWNGTTSVRFGQLAADMEFFLSNLSEIFLQSDWATITALNLPSGGPAYPLSTPGVRIKVEPSENLAVLFAVYNGDPAGPGEGSEQARNRYGLNFRVRDPAFMMFETQVRSNQRKEDTGLARTVKIGWWSHLGAFNDQRFAQGGTPLAAQPGSPIQHRGNYGVYGVIEQQIYRPAGGSAASGVSLFSRISASPSDRNPIDFFIDGGVVFANMISQRPDDRFGASVIYARFSNGVRAFDRDQIALGSPGIVRDYEINLELTYQAQIGRGWTAQPVVTYIWHPDGDSRRNALVTGAKTIWKF